MTIYNPAVQKTCFGLFPLKGSLVWLVLAFLSSQEGLCQIPLLTSREKSAMVKMQEKKWSDARELLETALEKNPSSIEGLYALTFYFSSPANPKFNPDTAKALLSTTGNLFKKTDAKSQERLSKFPLTQQILNEQKIRIDQLAFDKAYGKSSVEALTHFIKNYADAPQRAQAILKRDSLSFETALRRNTAQAYKTYINQWPESHLKNLAAQKFDELNFKEKTRNGTANEFESFYFSFPESRWRDQALENIFELTTLDGQKKSFENFAAKFPGTTLAQRSLDIIAHLNPDYGSEVWIPIAEKNKLGFMGFEGQILVKPKYDSLPYSVTCSNEHAGLVLLPDGIYSRKGRRLLNGSFTQVRNVGAGFLITAKNKNEYELIHETGWKPLNEPIKNAGLIANHFLAIQVKDKWQLSGLAGQLILSPVYDSIFQIGSVAVFKKSGKYQFVKQQDILAYKEGKVPGRVVDDISVLGANFIKIKVGSMEEVLNENLVTIIPMDRHVIRFSPAGFIIEKNNSLTLYDWPLLKNKLFKKIEFPEPWMKTQSATGLNLYFLKDQTLAASSVDSIWFNGKFAFAKKRDSITLFTPLKQKVGFLAEDEVRFLSSTDSGLFFLVKKKTQLQLFDAQSGKKVVSGAYSEITPVTKNLFTVKLKSKIGLVKSGGREVLAADYDAILYQNGWFSLLREKKFGGYNPASGKLLKPIYDANLVPYSEDLMMARKNKKWGIINLTQKPEKAIFIFDEVKYINDSLALVKKQENWSMMRVHTTKTIADQITDWQSVENNERIIFKSKGLYGLISSTTGILVPATYSEILWLSDDQKTLFIGITPKTEKEIQLDYFDRYGRTLQKFSTSTDLLDQVLCDN